ncbi:MAG TPA: formate dehydrogenase subunit delta [Thiobacillaceae bacterium]|jgi:formate dehydrogenase subunit delta|nr:formate dehydrogenase subunit delta [Thiobacillaceae bacterium]HNA82565.1 formate dehydrogenase subunit delta [Thiobacillaceae bacterium]HNH88742.1 formate dehydrogenase subunit delta [Thiobacillaceae bacterium]HNI07429.1 formate dehydrogenase subunit delta [Thiobacillaceae bacterium]
MDIARLIQMANQIGAFFDAEPERDLARKGIAEHLARFWEPRMRALLLAHLDDKAGEGLHALVREALAEHRTRLERRREAA